MRIHAITAMYIYGHDLHLRCSTDMICILDVVQT